MGSSILRLLSIVSCAISFLVARCLQLTPFEDVCHYIDVLVSIENGIEQLFAWAAHDSLSTGTGVENVERINDFCERDGLVTCDPLFELFAVDDDHKLVGGLRVGLEYDFVEGLHFCFVLFFSVGLERGVCGGKRGRKEARIKGLFK